METPPEMSITVVNYERIGLWSWNDKIAMLDDIEEPTQGWVRIIACYDHPILGHIYILNEKYRWGLFDDWEEAGIAFIRLTEIHNYYHKYNEQKKD